MNVTYEEYKNATKFARIRYRFGVFIQLVALILLIFLILYTTINIEEMKTNPIKYTEERMGVRCFNQISFEQYDSGRNITSITEG